VYKRSVIHQNQDNNMIQRYKKWRMWLCMTLSLMHPTNHKLFKFTKQTYMAYELQITNYLNSPNKHIWLTSFECWSSQTHSNLRAGKKIDGIWLIIVFPFHHWFPIWGFEKYAALHSRNNIIIIIGCARATPLSHRRSSRSRGCCRCRICRC